MSDTPMPSLDLGPVTALADAVRTEVRKAIIGQSDTVHLMLVALLSRGHILLEGVPGTAKTFLAQSFAAAVGLKFGRIQFTPDLLPSDILGVSILNPKTQTFQFHEGPIFANLILADEINRASPRTQSALLEAMAENQVSIDGMQRKLHDPFFVIATQNPVDSHGTYPLPEAQMDRFAIQFGLGYLSASEEVAILSNQMQSHPLEKLECCVTLDELFWMKEKVKAVQVSPELQRYIVNIVNSTRHAEGVQLGASPRGSIALMKIAQALALFDGYQAVRPKQIQEVAVSVLAHRLVMDPQAQYSGQTSENVVKDILKNLAVPNSTVLSE